MITVLSKDAPKELLDGHVFRDYIRDGYVIVSDERDNTGGNDVALYDDECEGIWEIQWVRCRPYNLDMGWLVDLAEELVNFGLTEFAKPIQKEIKLRGYDKE